jgi:hypothetical protein
MTMKSEGNLNYIYKEYIKLNSIEFNLFIFIIE